MSKPDWSEAPEDAQYARHWMGKWHWFKQHPTLKKHVAKIRQRQMVAHLNG